MKTITEAQVVSSKEEAMNSIEDLIKATSMEDEEQRKRTYNYLDWMHKKTKMVIDEKNYVCLKNEDIKRGSVVWVEFGFNISCEFGGRHPAVVLRRTGNSIFVLPLSSQEPSHIKPYHVKIPKVYGFKNMVRWCNVLKIQNVSIQRVDTSASIGNVKGQVLNDINAAIQLTHIF